MVVVAFYLSGRSIGGVIGYLRPVLKELREGIDSSFRIDIPLTLIIVAHLIFFLPVVARNTENPRALAAFSNDEPFLTLALDGTAAGALFLLFIDARWYSPVSYALTLRLNAANTVRAINNWAEQSRISERTSILYDDLSYFDPKRFPNAHMHGGVLTWPAVLRKHPDIVVLCSSLYGAVWYQNLIAIQRLDRQSMDPFSMRLYQDLLPSRHFRVPHLPEVTLLKTINPPQEMAPWAPERTEWGLKKLWTVDSVRIAQLARYKKCSQPNGKVCSVWSARN